MVGAREKVRQRDEEGRNEGCEDAKETGSQSEGGNKGRRERERDFHSWINKCRGEAFVLLKKMQREEPWLFSA